MRAPFPANAGPPPDGRHSPGLVRNIPASVMQLTAMAPA